MENSVKESAIKKDKDGWYCECPDCENIHRVGMSGFIKMFICNKSGGRMKEKVCRGKCKERKPLSEFYRDSRLKDGHANSCKICKGIQMEKSKNEPKKQCKRGKKGCKKIKYLTEFYRDARVKGGFSNLCKKCRTKERTEIKNVASPYRETQPKETRNRMVLDINHAPVITF